jgi:hypothetical protein
MWPRVILSIFTFISIKFFVTSLQFVLGHLGNLDTEVTPTDSPYRRIA